VPRLSASLVIAAGCSLTLAGGARAQAPVPAVYGGGAIIDRAAVSNVKTYAPNLAIGLRRTAQGASVEARVSFSLSCARVKGGGWRSTDVVASGSLNADGSFHIQQPVGTKEMGTVKLTLDGVLRADGADGTARLRTHWPCGGQARPWTARPVDPRAPLPAAPPAPVDGVLYGVTDQGIATGAPHGVVARVVDGATKLHLFDSYTSRCRGTTKRGPYRSTVTFQNLYEQRPIAAGVWTYRHTGHQTAAEHRRGVDFRRVFAMQGVSAAPR
jgi:hypothetical protein